MDINSNTVCRDISDFPALLKPANFQVRKDIFKFEFQDVQEAPSSAIMNPTAYCPAVETPPAHCPAAKTSPAPCPAVETAPVSCSSALLLLAEPGPYYYHLVNPRPVEAPELSTSDLTSGQVSFPMFNSTYTNPPVPSAGITLTRLCQSPAMTLRPRKSAALLSRPRLPPTLMSRLRQTPTLLSSHCQSTLPSPRLPNAPPPKASWK